MVELIIVIKILVLFILLLKRWNKTGITSAEKEKVSEKLNQVGIVGKSTFVLTTTKSSVTKTDLSGKMDIEVPLEYEPDMETIEEQEELEQLGLSTELSSELTFEEMMEVVNEVESVQPKNPVKAGRLLYENENTEWVDQMASSSSDYQKRIGELIDLHLGKLTKSENYQVSEDRLSRFDISEYC